jgi:hypothetical protein
MYHVLHHEVHRNANLSRSRPTQSNDTCSQPFAANHTPSTLPAAQMNTCSQICYRTAVRAARRGRLAPREQLSIPSIACHEPSARSITRSTASQPHRSRWAALLVPFWQPNGTSRATTFTMGSSTGFVCMQGRDAISGNQHAISPKREAELHRRDHIGIRALIGVRPPCSTLQRRPPRRSCSW